MRTRRLNLRKPPEWARWFSSHCYTWLSQRRSDHRLRADAPLKIFPCVARIFGFVAGRLAESGIPEVYFLPHERNRALTVLRNAIGITELTRLTAVGAAMTEDEAIALAHALE